MLDPSRAAAAADPQALDSPAAPSPALDPALDESEALARAIAEAASDRKGGDITILKVADVSYLADYFILVTGFSRAQVRAITEAVLDRVETEFGRSPLRTEGQSEGSWILQDYGDAIVHVMLPEERDYYDLEAFWGHAERLDWAASLPADSAGTGRAFPGETRRVREASTLENRAPSPQRFRPSAPSGPPPGQGDAP